MSLELWLAAGYALLMWGAALGLQRHARKSEGESWIARDGAAFVRAIALIPLAAGGAVLLGVLALERSALACAIVAPLALLLGREGWRGWASRSPHS
jgi:hypothetical protein